MAAQPSFSPLIRAIRTSSQTEFFVNRMPTVDLDIRPSKHEDGSRQLPRSTVADTGGAPDDECDVEAQARTRRSRAGSAQVTRLTKVLGGGGLRSLLQAPVKWSDTAMGLKNLNDDSGVVISANERIQTEVSR